MANLNACPTILGNGTLTRSTGGTGQRGSPRADHFRVIQGRGAVTIAGGVPSPRLDPITRHVGDLRRELKGEAASVR
jgi:hypothetical protein